MFSIGRIVLNLPLIIRDVSPIIIAHHPLCRRYDNHVVFIGKRRVCLGCTTIYPIFFATMFLLFALRSDLPYVNPVVYIVAGFLPVFLKAAPITNKLLKILVNVVVGAGMALALFGIYILQVHWIFKVLFFIVLLFITSYVYYKRFLKHLKICSDVCEHKANWSKCPGVKKMYRALEYDLGLKKRPK